MCLSKRRTSTRRRCHGGLAGVRGDDARYDTQCSLRRRRLRRASARVGQRVPGEGGVGLLQ